MQKLQSLTFCVLLLLPACASLVEPPENCGARFEEPAHGGWSVDELMCRAERGQKSAQRDLGIAYEEGTYNRHPVDVDILSAIKWYKRAAASTPSTTSIWVPGAGDVPGHVMNVNTGPGLPGDRVAMLRLANIYTEGKGVAADPEKASKWSERAMKFGSPDTVPLTDAEKEALQSRVFQGTRSGS